MMLEFFSSADEGTTKQEGLLEGLGFKGLGCLGCGV